MFKNTRLIRERDELLDEINELKVNTVERDKLREQVRELKDDIQSLKSKKKIEEEDIKHMIRLKEERMEVANEKKALEMHREKDKAIAEVKDTYRDKLEGRLEIEVKNMKEMYGQILERLPNINVKAKM